MSCRDYLKDQIPCIITHILSMVGFTVFMSAVNIDKDIICILLISWALIVIFYIGICYCFRYRYFKQILLQLDSLDKKYLIAEVMDMPTREDDKIYYNILRTSNKSMIEEVSRSKRERGEYKEYIEQWIHDVKTPIAAMQLVCENNKSDTTRKVMVELEKISHFVDQALYYARSENVEKDYLIKEVVLSDMVHAAIGENKQLLLQNHISVRVENCEYTVYTDEKWIGFILNQLIVNGVKYRSDHPLLIFESCSEQSKVKLLIRDNGIGISASDLLRIFDKGFTGKNGRTGRNSTGIGLYLCKRLCDKLGIGISAHSKQGQGTTIELSFPKGDFVKVRG
ncbi:sensor histidine kinase [Sporanaerobacter sp. PP17-6a]|uniref:sensor histidine kinase n=1 Tax=Sporanaerobacter sp. PP17-6a TaxID=1891289 RepID=UPI00089FFB55|nr:sensor histidine kinase [Sporanaerobacter sp. PP17-6a]SCL97038.1 Sensor histidine kinase GraS [Sporanaerobacter sp. PP17-6a]